MDEAISATVGALLIEKKVDDAAKFVEGKLRAEQPTRFASLLDTRFTNSPSSVLEHINGFITACSQEFDVKAVYLPHNGFVFNNDRWHFDSNGYDVSRPLTQEYEWLCEPRRRDWETFTLTGLEAVQADFDWYVGEDKYEDPHWELISDIAELLVKVRFVQLIASALANGPLVLPIPVITTAYGFDFFCQFDP
jgi:hypothetical protein